MVAYICVDGSTVSITGDATAQGLGLKISIPPITPPTLAVITDTVPAVPSQTKFTIGSTEVLISDDLDVYVSGLTLNYITTLFAVTPGILVPIIIPPDSYYIPTGISTITTVDTDGVIILTTTFKMVMSGQIAQGGTPAQNAAPLPDTVPTYTLDVTITNAAQTKARSN